jgi:Na+-driven multidrug efflux pump
MPADETPLVTEAAEWLVELNDLVHLTVPMAISRISWIGMKTTDTGLVGHTSTLYLEATALSDLWTQSTGCVLSGAITGVVRLASIANAFTIYFRTQYTRSSVCMKNLEPLAPLR